MTKHRDNFGRVVKFAKAALHRMSVIAGAATLTLAFFLVLPFLQSHAQPPRDMLSLVAVDSATLPPPPPQLEDTPEEEDEPEEEPPELAEEIEPLDLSQLELSLDTRINSNGFSAHLDVSLKTIAASSEEVEALFSLSDLDQKPRCIYQPSPVLSASLRKKAPGTVYIIFAVNQSGRVEQPIVQSSSNPVFERAALAAVKQWKFEPGKRKGDPVSFRMRVPITFPRDS